MSVNKTWFIPDNSLLAIPTHPGRNSYPDTEVPGTGTDTNTTSTNATDTATRFCKLLK